MLKQAFGNATSYLMIKQEQKIKRNKIKMYKKLSFSFFRKNHDKKVLI